MKPARSSESWRSVRSSPALPKMTSSWATAPLSRRECTGTPSTEAPRAPSRAWRWRRELPAYRWISAGLGDGPCRVHRSATRCVDLVGMVRLDDLDRRRSEAAASRANFIMKTAPMPKFGAMTTPRPRRRLRARPRPSRDAIGVKPARSHHDMHTEPRAASRLAITASGTVKSTTTSARPRRRSAGDPAVVDPRNVAQGRGSSSTARTRLLTHAALPPQRRQRFTRAPRGNRLREVVVAIEGSDRRPMSARRRARQRRRRARHRE